MFCLPFWYFPHISSPFPYIPFHYYLYSPNEWEHIMFVLLRLTYFTQHNTLQFHPRWSKWWVFVISNSWVIFHCIHKPHLLYPLERMRRKGNPLTLLVGMWPGAATLENCVKVPQRVKNRPALRPSNCTAGDLPQRYRCSEKLKHLHPNVYSSNVHNSQTVEGASVSIERWMDKEDVVYVYNGILLSY